jgi:hypothetical protein
MSRDVLAKNFGVAETAFANIPTDGLVCARNFSGKRRRGPDVLSRSNP